MPIHKMGFTKPVIKIEQPSSVHWSINNSLTHRPIRQMGGLRWEIYTQRIITIPPKESVSIALGLGVRMKLGRCKVTLRQYITDKECGLQDDIITSNVTDITIAIQNNSDSEVSINDGDSLCFVNYHIK